MIAAATERNGNEIRVTPSDMVHPVDRDDVHDLVESARAGDRGALAALYDRFCDRVFRYAFVLTGQVADAEDVTAETFVIAWRRLGSFRWVGAPFVSWLYGIAQRTAERTARRRSREVSSDHERSSGAAADRDAATQPIVDVEQRLDLHRLLQRLTEEHRRIVLMRFYGSMTAEEIGAALGKSANAVRQAQFDALRRLRRLTATGAHL